MYLASKEHILALGLAGPFRIALWVSADKACSRPADLPPAAGRSLRPDTGIVKRPQRYLLAKSPQMLSLLLSEPAQRLSSSWDLACECQQLRVWAGESHPGRRVGAGASYNSRFHLSSPDYVLTRIFTAAQ